MSAYLVSWLRESRHNSCRLGKLKLPHPKRGISSGGACFSLPGAVASQCAPIYSANFRDRRLVCGTTGAAVRCTPCGLQRLAPLPLPGELKTYDPDSYWFAPASNNASHLPGGEVA
jgi:hypothetical protein